MAKQMQVFIVTIQQGEEVDYKIVDDNTFTVGRSLDATLAFSDPNISRIHLIVTLKHERIWIEDQGSANGTFVNSQKIPAQKTISVEPGDKVKLGKSEIYLSFNLLEKCFKKEEIVKSQLPKDEKEGLMRIIQGAHAEAQKIVKLAQEGHDKLVKIAENKASNIENASLLKQDDILQNASMQASQIVQDAKRKGVGIVNEAQEEAQLKVQDIYSKADVYKEEADTYYKSKIEDAQKDSERILKESENLANKMVEETREKVTVMREIAHKELEHLKTKQISDIEEMKRAILSDAEKEKELLLQRTERESQKKLDALVKEAEENNRIEREKIILTAENEVERLKTESAEEIEKLRDDISALNVEAKKWELQIKELKDERRTIVLKHEKEDIDRRANLEKELKNKEDEADRALAERKVELEERFKKRQDLAEKDISARYMDLEVEEERKNKELDEFRLGLKKKEDEFWQKVNKEKEQKISDLNEREQLILEFEVKTKKEAQDWASEKRKEAEDFDKVTRTAVASWETKIRNDVESWEKKIRSEVDLWEKKIRSETESWIDSEKKQHEQNWAERELDLRNMESQKRLELQKWLESEQERLNSDWKRREQNLTDEEQRKHSEVEAWKKDRQTEFINKNKNLIEENGVLETRVQDLKTVVQQLTDSEIKLKSTTEQLKSQEVESGRLVLSLKKESELLSQNKETLLSEGRSLEKRLGEVRFEIENHSGRIESLRKEFENQKLQFKGQLENEKQQMVKDTNEQINQMKVLELDKLKKAKESLLSELLKMKERLAKEIHSSVEKSLVGAISSDKLTQLSAQVLEKITHTIEEQTAHVAVSNDVQTGQLKNEADVVLKKQKRERLKQMAMGFVLGAVMLGAGQGVYWKIEESKNPVRDLVDEQRKEWQKNQEAKLYKPKREPDVKDTYVDLVLYTDQFHELYLSQQFHEKFGKAAIEYLLRTWRTEEEKSIQVVAMSNTLVKNLLEKKDSVSTDFLEQGIFKLREMEKETEDRIAEILGSKVKYQSYRNFEKRFFTEELEKFYLARGSAQPPVNESTEQVDQSSHSK